MTLDQFYRAVGGTAAEAAPRLGGADHALRFLRLFPLDDSFPQLSEALGRGDVQTAFRAAHTLKGLGGAPLGQGSGRASVALMALGALLATAPPVRGVPVAAYGAIAFYLHPILFGVPVVS